MAEESTSAKYHKFQSKFNYSSGNPTDDYYQRIQGNGNTLLLNKTHMKKPTVEADSYGGDNHGDIYNIQVLNSGG